MRKLRMRELRSFDEKRGTLNLVLTEGIWHTALSECGYLLCGPELVWNAEPQAPSQKAWIRAGLSPNSQLATVHTSHVGTWPYVLRLASFVFVNSLPGLWEYQSLWPWSGFLDFDRVLHNSDCGKNEDEDFLLLCELMAWGFMTLMALDSLLEFS